MANCCFSSAVLIDGVDEEVGDGPISGPEPDAACSAASLSNLFESASEESLVVEVVELHTPEGASAERSTRDKLLEKLDMIAVLAVERSSLFA